uniref:hypothetical protein n=1 Tax=Chromobacterium amazonense TaxID=1382803 RepID=UPI003F795534
TLLYIYSFLFIYTPDSYISINVIHPLAFFAYIAMSMLYLMGKKILFPMVLKKFFLLNLLALIIGLYISLQSYDFYYCYKLFIVAFETVPCLFLIYLILEKLDFDLKEKLSFIMNLGFLQIIFVIATIIFPELRLSIIENSQNQDLLKLSNFGDLAIRTFGFSRGYTFAMPMFLGLCIAVALYMKGRFNTKHWLSIPLFVIAIALNARIGLVILPLLLVLNFLYRSSRFRLGILVISISVLSIGLIASEVNIFQYNDNSEFASFSRVYDSFDDLYNLANGKETGTFNDLGKMNILPSGYDLLTGTGKDIFFGENSKYPGINSDIGYVNDIFFGGLLFSLLLTGVYCSCFFISTNDNKLKILNYGLILFLIIANYKGSILNSNEFINGYLLLTLFISEAMTRKEKALR